MPTAVVTELLQTILSVCVRCLTADLMSEQDADLASGAVVIVQTACYVVAREHVGRACGRMVGTDALALKLAAHYGSSAMAGARSASGSCQEPAAQDELRALGGLVEEDPDPGRAPTIHTEAGLAEMLGRCLEAAPYISRHTMLLPQRMAAQAWTAAGELLMACCRDSAPVILWPTAALRLHDCSALLRLATMALTPEDVHCLQPAINAAMQLADRQRDAHALPDSAQPASCILMPGGVFRLTAAVPPSSRCMPAASRADSCPGASLKMPRQF